MLSKPVIDMTGLKGFYDIDLEWTPIRGRTPEERAEALERSEFSDDPNLFRSLQNLGLKLEPRKAPLPILVVDHIERVPTEN